MKNILRRIGKFRKYYLLNIFGLTICCILISLIVAYIINELSYDKHYKYHDRIYRLESEYISEGRTEKYAVTSIPVGPVMKNEIPEIENFVRFRRLENAYISVGDVKHVEKRMYFTDSTIFEVFSHNFIFGTPEKALTAPYSIVFTESAAKKYFGNENPLGKRVLSIDSSLFTVTGVIEDIPFTSHLKFDVLISVSTSAKMVGKDVMNSTDSKNFWHFDPYTYIMLKPNTSIESVLSKFLLIYDKYMKEYGKVLNSQYRLKAKPLAKVHLHSNDLEYDLPTGNYTNIYILMLTVIFLSLIAVTNYVSIDLSIINLRKKEIGLKKILGISSAEFFWELVLEKVLIIIPIIIITFIVDFILLSSFNNFSFIELSYKDFFSGKLMLIFFIIAIVICIVSFIYPFTFFSKIKPVKDPIHSKSNIRSREFIVGGQQVFAFTMFLAIIVISQQMKYVFNRDLGFDKQNVLVFSVTEPSLKNKLESFKSELLRKHDVQAVSLTSNHFIVELSEMDLEIEDNQNIFKKTTINYLFADQDFVDVYKFKILTSRNEDNVKGAVINETVAKQMGFSQANDNYESALGKQVRAVMGGKVLYYKIIGVVKDFNYMSFRSTIEPLIIFPVPERFSLFNSVSIRVNKVNNEIINSIYDIQNKLDQKSIIDVKVLEDIIFNNYRNDISLLRIFSLLTVFIILIAMFGVFSLFTYLSEQKVKDVSIHKTFGASLFDISLIFIKRFTILIGIVSVISSILSYVILKKWLLNYAYKIDLTLNYFVLVTLAIYILMLLVVTNSIIKLNFVNPAKVLRNE